MEEGQVSNLEAERSRNGSGAACSEQARVLCTWDVFGEVSAEVMGWLATSTPGTPQGPPASPCQQGGDGGCFK